MDKIIAWVEKYVQPLAGKIAGQKHLKALTNTFMTLIPFMTIGSFALIIISPVMDYTTMEPGFACSFMKGWTDLAATTGPIFGYIYLVCMGLLGIYVSIGLGYYLCKTYKMNSLFPIFVAFASFMIVATMCADAVIDTSYFGSEGIFTAIVITILAFELYRFLTEKKVGYINMADMGVPEAIAESIANMVPCLIVMFVFAGVSGIILMTTGYRIPELLGLVFTPLSGILNTLPGFVLVNLLIQLFWWFGVHDSVITGPLTAFIYAFMAENAAAYAAGTAATDLPYIVSSPFSFAFVTSVSNIAMALCALRSKSKQLNTIGKLGIVPAIFNVTEPFLFGLPIVYNGSLLIPFVACPVINTTIAYLAMSAKLVNHTFLDPSWNMPGPISAFLSTMDYRAVILWVLLFVLNLIIWTPFFKSFEKIKVAEEAEEAAQNA